MFMRRLTTVFIGDIYRTGEQIQETVELLTQAEVTGIWGNHDFGLWVDPSDEIRRSHAPSVPDYMAALQHRLEVEGCLFTHVEPWLNPEELTDLWFVGGPPVADD